MGQEIGYCSKVARLALIIIWIAALGSVGALGVIGYDMARSEPVVPKATANRRCQFVRDTIRGRDGR